MIVAFSTSSQWASVALISESGQFIWAASEDAPRRASEACLKLLARAQAETGRALSDATLFAADLGPGSFTGVRVGIVMAKTLAWVHRKPCAGATCFDLISPNETVLVPSKKAEWFVREPGQTPYRTSEVPTGSITGFGFGQADFPPLASGFARLVSSLRPVNAEAFVPEYLMEPSISTPKKPFRGAQSG